MSSHTLQNCALETVGLMGEIAVGSIAEAYVILLTNNCQKQ